MFDPDSRYAKVPTYTMKDRRGRDVTVVAAAPAPGQTLAGYHLRKDGQRLDLLAGRYLADAYAFWRITELADAMHAEALSLVDEIPIPRRHG
jgi:hypothetical protein